MLLKLILSRVVISLKKNLEQNDKHSFSFIIIDNSE